MVKLYGFRLQDPMLICICNCICICTIICNRICVGNAEFFRNINGKTSRLQDPMLIWFCIQFEILGGLGNCYCICSVICICICNFNRICIANASFFWNINGKTWVSVARSDAYLILHPVWNPRGPRGIWVNLIETIWEWEMKVVAKVVST